MQQLGYTRGLELFRPFWLGALLVTLVMLLASCSAGSILTDSKYIRNAGQDGSARHLPGDHRASARQAQGRCRPHWRWPAAIATSASSKAGSRPEPSRSPVPSRPSPTVPASASSTSGSCAMPQGVLLQTIDGEDNAGLSEAADPWSVGLVRRHRPDRPAHRRGHGPEAGPDGLRDPAVGAHRAAGRVFRGGEPRCPSRDRFRDAERPGPRSRRGGHDRAAR